MRLDDLSSPVRPRHPITVTLNGKDILVDVRILTPTESATALEKAYEYAVARGVKEPTDVDELYELGKQAATLALACVDHEAAADDPNPRKFFSNFQQVLDHPLMSREIIALMHANYVAYEEQASMRILRMSDSEFLTTCKRLWGGDHGPFCSMRPGMQLSFTRTLAGLYLTSLQSSSSSSEPSPPTNPPH